MQVYISAAEYRLGRSSLAQTLNHPNLSIKYLPDLGFLPLGRWRKLLTMFTYACSAALVSLFSTKVEMNYFLSQPPLFAIWGWVLKLLRGQRYFCMIMDLYPDVFIQYGFLKRNSLIARLLKGLARFVWQQADGIVVIGRCQREKLLREGVPAEKLHFIPNWANTIVRHPIPANRNALRKNLGLDDSFVVLYSGNMGISHDFQTLLDAAALLQPYPNIQFVLFGDGPRRCELEMGIEIRALKNVRLLPFQPTERLAESLSLGEVHVVTLRSGFEGLVVPSKAYGAQAVGRPLIYVGHPASEIGRMVKHDKVGMVVLPGEGKYLAKCILKYFQNPGLRVAHGRMAFKLYQDQYQPSHSLDAYRKLLLRTIPHLLS